MHRQDRQQTNCTRHPGAATIRPGRAVSTGAILTRTVGLGAAPPRRPLARWPRPSDREPMPQTSVRFDLPDRSGLEVAGRCMPRSGPVGGDWFDVVTVGRHHVAFCIGDVAGRGVEAAALMAPLRFAARSYMVGGYWPSAVLAKVSRLVDLETDGRIATAVCGRLNLVSGELVLASAGHPAPLLVEPRGCRYLPLVIGPPLGVLGPAFGLARECATSAVELRPGSAVVAFTDGLFECRKEPIDAGLERIRAALERMCAGLEEGDAPPMGQALDHLLASMARARDDVALLGLRWSRSPGWG